MILRYLGESFDIHGGGLDLRFPHHENEQAQSRAAGYGFARYWMHNGWVTSSGDKISKSLGNATPLDDLLQHMRPLDLRYYLGSAHYRSNLELTDSALSSHGGDAQDRRLHHPEHQPLQADGGRGDAAGRIPKRLG